MEQNIPSSVGGGPWGGHRGYGVLTNGVCSALGLLPLIYLHFGDKSAD